MESTILCHMKTMKQQKSLCIRIIIAEQVLKTERKPWLPTTSQHVPRETGRVSKVLVSVSQDAIKTKLYGTHPACQQITVKAPQKYTQEYTCVGQVQSLFGRTYTFNYKSINSTLETLTKQFEYQCVWIYVAVHMATTAKALSHVDGSKHDLLNFPGIKYLSLIHFLNANEL